MADGEIEEIIITAPRVREVPLNLPPVTLNLDVGAVMIGTTINIAVSFSQALESIRNGKDVTVMLDNGKSFVLKADGGAIGSIDSMTAEGLGGILKVLGEWSQSPRFSSELDKISNSQQIEIYFGNAYLDENNNFNFFESNEAGFMSADRIFINSSHPVNSDAIGAADTFVHEVLHITLPGNASADHGDMGCTSSGSCAMVDTIIDDIFGPPTARETDALDYYNAQFRPGGSGNDSINGSGGRDRIDGNSGNDTLNGFSATDELRGGDGADTLNGGDGNDVLVGGPGADRLFGGNGDDILVIDASDSLTSSNIRGDAGIDTIILEGTTGRTIDLDVLSAENGIGGDGDDWIYGTSGTNVLGGGKGADRLFGEGGNDEYLYALGDGVDRVTDTGGTDIAFFGPGLGSPTYVENGTSLIIRFSSTSALTWHNWRGTSTRFETLDFDGVQISWAAVKFQVDGGGWGFPVAIDLDGDGIELLSPHESKLKLDANGDGIKDDVSWLSGDDAWLALDRDGSGRIDDFSEISFVDDLEGATTDMEGLRAYDTNGDLMLDEQDLDFDQFLLWQDVNGNGKSEKGELMTLEEAGIEALSLDLETTNTDLTDMIESVILNTAKVRFADGTETSAGDVALYFEARHSGGVSNFVENGDLAMSNQLRPDSLDGRAASKQAFLGEDQDGLFVPGLLFEPAPSNEDILAAQVALA